MSAWGRRFYWTLTSVEYFSCASLILTASPHHCHVSQLRNQCWAFRDLPAECSEGPGLVPWQPDSTPMLSPSVRPWVGGGGGADDEHSSSETNCELTDERRGLWNMWRFFCEPKCTSVVFSVCQQRATMNSQVVWQRLIYGDLLNSTSWLTTQSF